jgi:hypothetical protein
MHPSAIMSPTRNDVQRCQRKVCPLLFANPSLPFDSSMSATRRKRRSPFGGKLNAVLQRERGFHFFSSINSASTSGSAGAVNLAILETRLHDARENPDPDAVPSRNPSRSTRDAAPTVEPIVHDRPIVACAQSVPPYSKMHSVDAHFICDITAENSGTLISYKFLNCWLSSESFWSRCAFRNLSAAA